MTTQHANFNYYELDCMTVKSIKAYCQRHPNIFAGYSKHTKKADLIEFVLDAQERWDAEEQNDGEDYTTYPYESEEIEEEDTQEEDSEEATMLTKHLDGGLVAKYDNTQVVYEHEGQIIGVFNKPTNILYRLPLRWTEAYTTMMYAHFDDAESFEMSHEQLLKQAGMPADSLAGIYRPIYENEQLIGAYSRYILALVDTDDEELMYAQALLACTSLSHEVMVLSADMVQALVDGAKPNEVN